MKDRISNHPARIKLNPVTGQENTYDMVRADDPTQIGTPINKLLLDHVIAAYGTTSGTNTAYTLSGDGGFSFTDGSTVRFKLHTDSGNFATLNVDGTGAKPLMVNDSKPMPAGIKAGTWLTATYSTTFDKFVISGGVDSGDLKVYRTVLYPDTSDNNRMLFTLPSFFKPIGFISSYVHTITYPNFYNAITTNTGAWFDTPVTTVASNVVAGTNEYGYDYSHYQTGVFILQLSNGEYEMVQRSRGTPVNFANNAVIYLVVFGLTDYTVS